MNNNNERTKYLLEVEMTLASLETRSNISTFLAGAIYIIISLVIQKPQDFVAPEYYIVLLFIGAMFLTFSSAAFFETASTAKSIKSSPLEFSSHLKRIENLSRLGNVLYALGILFFMIANIWMISKFGYVICVIATIISICFFYILIMKR